MTLPNAPAALVERAKIAEYLLSAAHPVGRFKAVFFRALGFTGPGWSELRDAIHAVAQIGAAVEERRDALDREDGGHFVTERARR